MWIFYFLCMFCGGIALIVYRERVQRVTGNFAFAEKYLGNGGTFNAIALVGLGLIVFSMLYVTGTIDFLAGPLGRIFFVPGSN